MNCSFEKAFTLGSNNNCRTMIKNYQKEVTEKVIDMVNYIINYGPVYCSILIVISLFLICTPLYWFIKTCKKKVRVEEIEMIRR